jgi:hypothetical protein
MWNTLVHFTANKIPHVLYWVHIRGHDRPLTYINRLLLPGFSRALFGLVLSSIITCQQMDDYQNGAQSVHSARCRGMKRNLWNAVFICHQIRTGRNKNWLSSDQRTIFQRRARRWPNDSCRRFMVCLECSRCSLSRLLTILTHTWPLNSIYREYELM